LIDDRQHPRHPQADGTDVGIGLCRGIIGAAAAEHLGFGQKLGVDFHADDDFIVH